MKTISETGLYLCLIGIELCTRDGTLIADPNLVHQIAKRESFSETGLSCCGEWILNSLPEMGDL